MRVCVLSRFSHVWLCVTWWTVAHQAPLSTGFSRQEHWSGLPFPSPMHESEKWKSSHSVVFDSSRPHELQPTRLLHPGIFQARVLEWGAIAFSDISTYLHLISVKLPSREWKWEVRSYVIQRNSNILVQLWESGAMAENTLLFWVKYVSIIPWPGTRGYLKIRWNLTFLPSLFFLLLH